MDFRPTSSRLSAAIAVALFALVGVAYWLSHSNERPKTAIGGGNANIAATDATAAPGPDAIDLSDSQLSAVKVEPVGIRDFPIEKQAVGSINFNEDLEVQVFTPYQGRIIALFAEVGNDVKKGQTLFTIDSPDLLSAESTLIAAAGVMELRSEERRVGKECRP